jgi:hypothetical protein
MYAYSSTMKTPAEHQRDRFGAVPGSYDDCPVIGYHIDGHLQGRAITTYFDRYVGWTSIIGYQDTRCSILGCKRTISRRPFRERAAQRRGLDGEDPMCTASSQ